MRVQGIGGVFLYAADAEALAGWYREHLGLETQRWGDAHGMELPSRDVEPRGRTATTTFAIFQAAGPLPEVRTARVNFRVDDLDALVAYFEQVGVEVERSADEGYGRFAWVVDPEGNRVELWEPPASGEADPS